MVPIIESDGALHNDLFRQEEAAIRAESWRIPAGEAETIWGELGDVLFQVRWWSSCPFAGHKESNSEVA